MKFAALLLLLGGLVCTTQMSSAQASPFRYRAYALGSNVAAILELTKGRTSDVRTAHARPARIEEISWVAPYTSTGPGASDPVGRILFGFFDDQLYRVVVTYDRDRIEGLTNADLVTSLSPTYGTPLRGRAKPAESALPGDAFSDAAVVAQWEDPTAIVTLTRDTYSRQVQLVLSSKALSPLAQAAAREAVRLDVREAPQRERDERTKTKAAADAEARATREANKDAFHP
jgi:hypothetical protein